MMAKSGKEMTNREILEGIENIWFLESENFLNLVRASGLSKSEDFKNRNLSDVDLSNLDLRGFNFSSTTFDNANFCGADLRGTGIEHEDLVSSRYDKFTKFDSRVADTLVAREVAAATEVAADVPLSEPGDGTVRSLEEIESELYVAVTADTDMRSLNNRRLEILRQLAAPEHLPILLERRFMFAIGAQVATILDEALKRSKENIPKETAEATEILREVVPEDAPPIDRWLNIVQSPNLQAAVAAAHRLEFFAKRLSRENIAALLDSSFDPDRLMITASLAAATENSDLASDLEQKARSLVDSVEGRRSMEGFASVIQALLSLNQRRGQCSAAIARVVFQFSPKVEITHYPWPVLNAKIRLNAEDIQALISQDENGAKAAVAELDSWSNTFLSIAENHTPENIDDTSLRKFRSMAQKEKNPTWLKIFTGAAAQTGDCDQVHWIAKIADNPAVSEKIVSVAYHRFGQVSESLCASIYRSLGYLSRLLLTRNRVAEAEQMETLLRSRYEALSEKSHRSIFLGLATGLGYLGHWQPLLEQLGTGEPWIHEAAINTFRIWMPKPPDGIPERERAAQWIARQLHEAPSPSPEVQSTLQEIQKILEEDVGSRV